MDPEQGRGRGLLKDRGWSGRISFEHTGSKRTIHTAVNDFSPEKTTFKPAHAGALQECCQVIDRSVGASSVDCAFPTKIVKARATLSNIDRARSWMAPDCVDAFWTSLSKPSCLKEPNSSSIESIMQRASQPAIDYLAVDSDCHVCRIWEVVWFKAAVRHEPRRSSLVVKYKPKGTLLEGTRSGNWIKLADGSGFLLVEFEGIQLIRPVVNFDRLAGQAPLPSFEARLKTPSLAGDRTIIVADARCSASVESEVPLWSRKRLKSSVCSSAIAPDVHNVFDATLVMQPEDFINVSSDEETAQEPTNCNWRCVPPSCKTSTGLHVPLLLRLQPDFTSGLSGVTLLPGDVFEVCSICSGCGGVLWLCRADGSGWAPDRSHIVDGIFTESVRLCEPVEIYNSGPRLAGDLPGDEVFRHPAVNVLLQAARRKVRDALDAQMAVVEDRWLLCIRSYARSGIGSNGAVDPKKSILHLTLAALELALGIVLVKQHCLIFVSHEDRDVTSGRYQRAFSGTIWEDRLVHGVRGADLQVRFIEEAVPVNTHVVIADDNLKSFVVERGDQELDALAGCGRVLRAGDMERRAQVLDVSTDQAMDRKPGRNVSGTGEELLSSAKQNSGIPELASLIARAGRAMKSTGAKVWGVNPSCNMVYLRNFGNGCRRRAANAAIAACPMRLADAASAAVAASSEPQDFTKHLGLVYGAFFGFIATQESRRYTRYGQVRDDVERSLRYWHCDQIILRFQRYAVKKAYKPGKFGRNKGGISAGSTAQQHAAESKRATRSMINEFAWRYARMAGPQESARYGLRWKPPVGRAMGARDGRASHVRKWHRKLRPRNSQPLAAKDEQQNRYKHKAPKKHALDHQSAFPGVEVKAIGVDAPIPTAPSEMCHMDASRRVAHQAAIEGVSQAALEDVPPVKVPFLMPLAVAPPDVYICDSPERYEHN